MKKQIAIFLFLIFTAAGLAAETGYKGISWGSGEFFIELYEGKEESPLAFKLKESSVKVYEKQILGEKTNLYYTLMDDFGLISVFYSTDEKNTERLKTKLTSKTLVDEVPFYKLDDGTIELLKEMDEKDPERVYEYLIGYTMMSMAMGLETEYRYKRPYSTGEAQIFIYDYNDDTRLYIFENVVPGRTVVVYFPHEEDY